MKAYFGFNDGDRSVGLWETEGSFECNVDMIETPKEREETRQRLAKLLEDFFDVGVKARVIFEDECPDCGHVTDKGVCNNLGCINNCDEAKEARKTEERRKRK